MYVNINKYRFRCKMIMKTNKRGWSKGIGFDWLRIWCSDGLL